MSQFIGALLEFDLQNARIDRVPMHDEDAALVTIYTRPMVFPIVPDFYNRLGGAIGCATLKDF